MMKFGLSAGRGPRGDRGGVVPLPVGPKILAVLLALLLVFQSATPAFETDQYNLPTVPLGDIGEEVNDYVIGNIREAIAGINAEIVRRQECLDGKRGNCESAEKLRRKLAYLRSEDAVAREVFEPMGGGIPPVTRSERWVEHHRFKAQPARYKAPFSKSIYRVIPTNYWTISETVNLFGMEIGTDKIAHLFQQGYTYFRSFKEASAKGKAEAEAARGAVRWGRMTENTYYGFLVSGVFSNGDLAANYAGMKFYLGLTRELQVGGQTRPPVLVLADGVWKFNEILDLDEQLIRPFITAHLNEALNPSVYSGIFGLRSTVRKTVARVCGDWRTRYAGRSVLDFQKLTANLDTWFGEDYGHRSSRDAVTIMDTCFGAKPAGSGD